MEYQIRTEGKVIGVTKLEGGDPPMGFVFGSVVPTEHYSKTLSKESLNIFCGDTLIKSKSVTIEDLTEEMGEICIEVTVLLESTEEYEKHFKHHSVAYDNQFK